MVASRYLIPADRSLRPPDALAEAVAHLRGAIPQTVFQLLEGSYARSWPDFTVMVRMDHINALWEVCCTSSSTAWTSGTQRCPGSLLPREALDWGEQLWKGQAVIPARPDTCVSA